MITLSCKTCGGEFKTYPCKIRVGKGKYCSKACSNPATLFQEGSQLGIETRFKKGQEAHNFKGWRYGGRNRRYKLIFKPGHPMADPRGYVREHRLVMAEKLGRYLVKEEEVHHIDGDGLNNHPDNLTILTKHEHLKLEHKNGRYKDRWNKRRQNNILKAG